MGLFKDVKKPTIRAGSTGAEVSSKRPSYVAKRAPCSAKCPMGNNVRDWLVPLAQYEAYGRSQAEAFETAWRQIAETNPFPAICGRLCQHSCEAVCNRKAKDGAVGINLLERFVGDYGVAHKLIPPTAAQVRPEAVAIVGAGPAGMACAYYLVRRGYHVSLFEAAPELGGMMRYGVPRSILPAEMLDGEIGRLVQLGLDCHCDCVVGQDVPLDDLRRDYRAIFFAIGLKKPAQLQPVTSQDGAVCIGELPAQAPEKRQQATEASPRVNNTVSLAIAQGLAVGESLVRHFTGETARSTPEEPVIGSDKMKLAWYPATAPHDASVTDVQDSAVRLGMSEADAIAEAKRCMSCGSCMDCETCWMYCTPHCIEKLPKGEHYKLKLDLCNGCGKCQETCPCGFIEMN
jgi:Pyruvate/2-oxoacid:ferredoxin oxidoreductase delta subunit